MDEHEIDYTAVMMSEERGTHMIDENECDCPMKWRTIADELARALRLAWDNALVDVEDDVIDALARYNKLREDSDE